MNHLTFLLINGPLVFLNALANAFYVFCIGCPLNGKRIKQPLQLLLGTLIGCSITYLMSFMVMIHFFFCLCVMVMSSLCTVVYLCGHMRRMVANGQPVSHPRLRSQVRVTVTGILQGVLYLICSAWTLYEFLPLAFIHPTTHFTVINLYMSGTTVALGVGQAVFRQRAADIWLRAAQCCREQQTEQGG
ncbi:uncharacterized protein LOC117538358 [Gymnodraco acuticeps]|uniref:Uncharacterized protein LOC117538358 n=1 Tax=Gymnodraco acuticeps TaxID=8218 RepID=A0A6P8T7W6_GYMAC|nr:uncharacterized protein LOC117538358 [Gymnodraco acuticeps]